MYKRQTLDDFQKISEKTPFIADLKPSGKYLMEDLHDIGGIPIVLKYLLEKGFLHGDCLTVTGKTLRENLDDVANLNFEQDVIRPFENPIKKSGHIRILYGNLASEGSVAKDCLKILDLSFPYSNYKHHLHLGEITS